MQSRFKAREVIDLFAPSAEPLARPSRRRHLHNNSMDELSWGEPLDFVGSTVASYLVSRSVTGGGSGLLD